MAARTAWVHLIPKFTSFVGAHTFTFDPVDVTAYDSTELVAWRSEMPSGATFKIELYESIDQESWTQIAISDPGADQQSELNYSLSMAWLKVVVVLATTGNAVPVVTAWLVGKLIPRSDG